MRSLIVAFLALFLWGSVDVDDAEARWRLFGRRRYRTYNGGSNIGGVWSGSVGIIQSDQDICQQKANLAAARNIRGHVGGAFPYAFEGVGWGVEGCATCRPGWNATLTGDASAVSASGVVYRCRSWR